MADEAHVLTDKLLKKLEKETAKEYSIAVRDMSAKLQEYLEKDEIKRLEQEKLLKAGKITKKEYQDWCFRHQMMGKRWEDMLNVLSEDMHHTNEIALSMAKDKMPDIYALNMNYGTYEIEHGGRIDTGFTLYNHDTAEYLLGDQRQLMPKPSPQRAKQIAANKDLQWNKKKIQSAVLQGVLQGENPYKVAERLRSVGQMNYNSSVRYARTMGTSAQNAGRYESYRRAKRLGVDLTIEWSATLDGRTRHDHRLMHGQRTEVDEPFHTPDGFTIYYPADCTGDSDAPQKEIWNCRCTLLAWVKGFEGDTVKSSPKMSGMSFDEWQNEKASKKAEQLNAQEAAAPKRKPVAFGDALAKSLGTDVDEFKQLVENASPAVRNTYTEYSDQLTSVEKRRNGGWCRSKTIVWDEREEGNKWGTLAHEYGHFIDSIIPESLYTSKEVDYINENGTKIFKNYKPKIVRKVASSSDSFLTAMRADRKLNRVFLTDIEANKKMRADIIGENNSKSALTSGIQDAFDGFWGLRSSNNKLTKVYWGHGEKYYNRCYNQKVKDLGVEKDVKQALIELGFDASSQTKVKKIMRDYEISSELWANIQSAKTVGGEELELMERYFPSACKAFDDIIGAI